MIESVLRIRFTDDEIFRPTKQGLFQLLVIVESEEKLSEVYDDLEHLEQYSSIYAITSEASILVMDPHARLSTSASTKYRSIGVATADEFETSPLCKNRPEPRCYDELRIAKELPGRRFIIVRPDRFVFAACKTIDELVYALEQIEPILHGRDVVDTRLSDL
jgi:hypothetical protein